MSRNYDGSCRADAAISRRALGSPPLGPGASPITNRLLSLGVASQCRSPHLADANLAMARGCGRSGRAVQVTDMDDQRSYSSPNRRDVAGAWVLCAVIAALTLGLVGMTRGGVPPAATVATNAAPCASDLGFICQPSAEGARKNVGPLAGLHRLSVSKAHPGDPPHG